VEKARATVAEEFSQLKLEDLRLLSRLPVDALLPLMQSDELMVRILGSLATADAE
jgi:hypothetical protein